MLTLEQWSGLAGLVAGLIFICLNVRARRSLLGSFFKVYYRYLISASILFTLGWATEFFETVDFASHDIADAVHHILLLAAGIIFVASSYYMPKEAAEHMK